VRRISDLPEEETRAELFACCGSSRWVERMLSQRPFKDATEVFESAVRIWRDLSHEDWLEAFRAHPRIGESGSAASQQEQAGMASAGDAMKAEMARANRDYEARFGWIYLVCATGRPAEEMLAFARQRMANAPDEELKVAAAEQERITKLRLEKLLEKGQ
jgi:2-oxo-4-hydroxy-4-carboxy-5-ureidoimidazoline decarboxylase